MLLANTEGQTWIGNATMIGNLGDLLGGGIALFVMMAVLLVVVGLLVVALWRIVDAANAAAPEHRTMEPNMVWLLLIPIFQAYWNFRALPEVSKSLAATMRDKGLKPDDCGQGVGVVWALLVAVIYILDIISWMMTGALLSIGAVSLAGMELWLMMLIKGLAGLAIIVCIVMYIIKVQGAKSMILAAGNTPSAPSAPAPPSSPSPPA